MATLATLLASDSDDFSSGEEPETPSETPRESSGTQTSTRTDAKTITSNQELGKKESDATVAVAAAARKKAQEEQMRKLRAAVLASMKKKATTSLSKSAKVSTTAPTKQQVPHGNSSGRARDDSTITKDQSNSHGAGVMRSRNAERSGKTSASHDRRPESSRRLPPTTNSDRDHHARAPLSAISTTSSRTYKNSAGPQTARDSTKLEPILRHSDKRADQRPEPRGERNLPHPGDASNSGQSRREGRESSRPSNGRHNQRPVVRENGNSESRDSKKYDDAHDKRDSRKHKTRDGRKSEAQDDKRYAVKKSDAVFSKGSLVRKSEARTNERPTMRKSNTGDDKRPAIRKSKTVDDKRPVIRKSDIRDDKRPTIRKSNTRDDKRPVIRKSDTRDDKRPVIRKSNTGDGKRPVTRKSDTRDDKRPISRRSVTRDKRPLDRKSDSRDDSSRTVSSRIKVSSRSLGADRGANRDKTESHSSLITSATTSSPNKAYSVHVSSSSRTVKLNRVNEVRIQAPVARVKRSADGMGYRHVMFRNQCLEVCMPAPHLYRIITNRMIAFETARHRAKRMKAGGKQNETALAPAVDTSNTTRVGYRIQLGNAKTVQRRTAKGKVMEVTLMPVPMRDPVRQVVGGRKKRQRKPVGRKKKRRNSNRR